MLLSDAWLEEGVRGSISSSNSGLFWAVFRPPDPGGRPPKNPYSVLQFSSQSSTQKIWYSVLRTDFRWYSVLRDPPPDTLLETYSSPE